MATKKITDLITRSSVTDDLYLPSDDGIESYKVSGAQMKAYILASVMSTYTATASQGATDGLVFLNPASSFTLTLLAASTLPGKRVTFIKTASDVTKQVTLGGVIGGVTNIKMSFPGERLTIVSDGTSWFIESWTGMYDNLYLSGDGATNYGTTDVRTRRFNATPVQAQGDAITFSDTAAAGSKFTVRYDGTYNLFWYDRKSVTGNYNSFTVNQTDPTISALTPIADTEVLVTRFIDSGADGLNWTGKLKAGDVIRCNDNGDYNSTATAKFQMHRVGY